MEELDPKAAARELKRMPKPKEPATAAEFGLAIASMVVGILISIGSIPTAWMLGWNRLDDALKICGILPFALAAAVCGYIGRKSALGVAGLALSILACIEAGAIVGLLEYRHMSDAFIALELQKWKKQTVSIENEVENDRVAIANAKKDEIAITADIERIKLACVQAERDRVSNLSLIEKLKLDAAAALNDSIRERDAREKTKLAELHQKEIEQRAAQEAADRDKREKEAAARDAAIKERIAKQQAENEAKEKAAAEKIKAIRPIYVLKDKRRIRAMEVSENSSDFWSIKDETGKTLLIDKSDVVEIEFQADH